MPGLLTAVELETAQLRRRVGHGCPEYPGVKVTNCSGLRGEPLNCKWKVRDQFARYRGPHIGRLCLQMRGVATDRDRLRGRADFQDCIHGGRTPHLHRDAFLDIRLEPGSGHRKGVVSRHKFRESKEAVRTRRAAVCAAGIALLQVKGSSRDDGPRRVLHRADQGASAGLGPCGYA